MPTSVSEGARLVQRAVRRARAPIAFHTRHVRLADDDLSGCTHLVTSREGLFAVSADRWRHLADGQFFGATHRNGSMFVFEALGPYRPPVNDASGRYHRGRVIELELGPDRIRRARVVVSGLANGVHQIDFIDGRLHLVDTYNSRILRLTPDLSEVDAVWYPFGRVQQEDWAGGYSHVNSITARGGRTFLLKHNGRPAKAVRPSELVEVDDDFDVVATTELNGNACHNIVVLEDGQLLVCGSDAGQLIDGTRVLAEVDSMFTRGLSVDSETIVVGSSRYTIRGGKHGRRYVPGHITFLDRGMHPHHVLELPAAPTDIRRLDGRDLGLADFDPRPDATGPARTEEPITP